MKKELSMSSTLYALLIASAAIAVALLAVFDIIPATVAQYVPLAVVPFVVARRGACTLRRTARGA
ncbi:hypothetical protein IP79_08325 [Porphyrobacter sp. AAP60]|nr:hypothetical protein IP79_08325 [Porphyrobacter sp. AAP60]